VPSTVKTNTEKLSFFKALRSLLLYIGHFHRNTVQLKAIIRLNSQTCEQYLARNSVLKRVDRSTKRKLLSQRLALSTLLLSDRLTLSAHLLSDHLQAVNRCFQVSDS